MHECHRTLQGLQLVHAEAVDSFAGTAARLELRFNNPSPQPRQMLQLQCQEGHAQRFELPASALTVHFAHFTLRPLMRPLWSSDQYKDSRVPARHS
jgi:hypothetical protein